MNALNSAGLSFWTSCSNSIKLMSMPRYAGFVGFSILILPNDPSLTTRPTMTTNCNESGMAGLDEAASRE